MDREWRKIHAIHSTFFSLALDAQQSLHYITCKVTDYCTYLPNDEGEKCNEAAVVCAFSRLMARKIEEMRENLR